MTPTGRILFVEIDAKIGCIASVDHGPTHGEVMGVKPRTAKALTRFVNEQCEKHPQAIRPTLEASGWWVFIENVPLRIERMVYPLGWEVG